MVENFRLFDFGMKERGRRIDNKERNERALLI